MDAKLGFGWAFAMGIVWVLIYGATGNSTLANAVLGILLVLSVAAAIVPYINRRERAPRERERQEWDDEGYDPQNPELPAGVQRMMRGARRDRGSS